MNLAAAMVISDKEKPNLSEFSDKDFDGHTAFAEMSAEERLVWLCHAAAFVEEVLQIDSVTRESE